MDMDVYFVSAAPLRKPNKQNAVKQSFIIVVDCTAVDDWIQLKKTDTEWVERDEFL